MGGTMDNQISVSKASKLLGVTRAELNEQLHAANISTFEGKVDYESLKSMAPAISLCEQDIITRVRFIREDVSKRDRRKPDDMSHRELAAKVKILSTNLMVETRTSDHYEQILVDLAGKLGELQTSKNDEVRKIAISLCEWLRENVRH
mgnify:CR=1 FL=1